MGPTRAPDRVPLGTVELLRAPTQHHRHRLQNGTVPRPRLMVVLPRIKRLFPLTYAVTRSVDVPYAAFIVVVIAILLFAVVTLGALVSSAYEYSPILSNDFNGTISMWYDRFLSKSWTPASRTCQGSLMKPGEGPIFDVSRLT